MIKNNYQNTKVIRNHLSIQMLFNDINQGPNNIIRKPLETHSLHLLSSFLVEESFRKQLIQLKKTQK
jgi:hypothetical protein